MRKVKKVALLDTSVASNNKGDKIIVEATKKAIRDSIPDAFIVGIPTHERMFKRSYDVLNSADAAVVAGSNLLSSDMWNFRQWRVGFIDSIFVTNLVFCGVGWWQYQDTPTRYSKFLIKKLSSDEHVHSVRDVYTKKMLKKVEIENVLNTSCPTMWSLGKNVEHFDSISNAVVFTVTCYKKNRTEDLGWIKVLQELYSNVYFWPQQAGDLSYLRSIDGINLSGVEFLTPGLDSYDGILCSGVDYVGTRLHGGIRSLQHGNRTLILSVDNRAREMSKDTGIPTAPRNEPETIRRILKGSQTIDISLPTNNIERWKQSLRDKVYE